jgi:hypothetical protein
MHLGSSFHDTPTGSEAWNLQFSKFNKHICPVNQKYVLSPVSILSFILRQKVLSLKLLHFVWIRPAVANRWSARKFWWSVEKFGHYLQFLCLLYCFIILYLFKTSSDKYHTNNFVIIKQVHFINY